jgi:LAO/AO transport system kinase
VDLVWEATQQRHARMKASGELANRQRRQNLRWLWSAVDDRLRQAVRTHPTVRAIRNDLEHQVLAGTLPPEAAARQILHAFGLAGVE